MIRVIIKLGKMEESLDKEELEDWFFPDVISRCNRTLNVRGLPVIIEGQEYRRLEDVYTFLQDNYRPVGCYDDEFEGVTLTLGETIH